MASVNKVMLLGRLGNQPELRYTQSNRAVTELRLATSRRYKGRDEQWTEQTEWHSVVVWGRDAENCERFLAKGRQVFIEGRLQTRDWVDQQSGQKRYKTEIVAERVQFVGGRNDGDGAGPREGYSAPNRGGGRDGGGNQPLGHTPDMGNDGGAYDPEGEIPF